MYIILFVCQNHTEFCVEKIVFPQLTIIFLGNSYVTIQSEVFPGERWFFEKQTFNSVVPSI
jgi:hypothetical protein